MLSLTHWLKLCNQQTLATQTTRKIWASVLSYEKRNTAFKQMQIIFQPGLNYCVGILVEDMTKFRESLGEIMALKQVSSKTAVDINRILPSTSRSLYTVLKIYIAGWTLKEYITEEEIFFFLMSLGNCQELNINLTKQWLKGDRRRADKYLNNINMEDREDLFIKIKEKNINRRR